MNTVSCIIPVYNCEKYISEAIESVLAQSHPVDQLIVVDDGSTDSTPALLESYKDRITVVRKEHSGTCKTLNQGLKLAEGDFITFLDADDTWHIQKTEKQLNFLTAHSDYHVVFSMIQEFVSPELPQGTVYARPEPMRGMNKTASMIRKTFMDSVGMFSETHNVGEFIDWYSRAQEHGLRSNIEDEVLTYRRVHLHNYTRVHRQHLQDFTQIIRRNLERRRMKTD